MKKIVTVISILCFLFTMHPLSAQNQAPPPTDYQANYMKNYEDVLGYTKKTSSKSTIHLSMLGWGVGLAIGIAILSAVIPQSKAAPSTSKNNGDSGSS